MLSAFCLLNPCGGDCFEGQAQLAKKQKPFHLEIDPKHDQRALMASSSILPPSSLWSEAEVNGFYECLLRHHKNFSRISSDLGTKSAKECVEYYYLWKNVCKEEARSFKNIFNSTSAVECSSAVTSRL